MKRAALENAKKTWEELRSDITKDPANRYLEDNKKRIKYLSGFFTEVEKAFPNNSISSRRKKLALRNAISLLNDRNPGRKWVKRVVAGVDEVFRLLDDNKESGNISRRRFIGKLARGMAGVFLLGLPKNLFSGQSRNARFTKGRVLQVGATLLRSVSLIQSRIYGIVVEHVFNGRGHAAIFTGDELKRFAFSDIEVPGYVNNIELWFLSGVDEAPRFGKNSAFWYRLKFNKEDFAIEANHHSAKFGMTQGGEITVRGRGKEYAEFIRKTEELKEVSGWSIKQPTPDYLKNEAYPVAASHLLPVFLSFRGKSYGFCVFQRGFKRLAEGDTKIIYLGNRADKFENEKSFEEKLGVIRKTIEEMEAGFRARFVSRVYLVDFAMRQAHGVPDEIYLYIPSVESLPPESLKLMTRHECLHSLDLKYRISGRGNFYRTYFRLFGRDRKENKEFSDPLKGLLGEHRNRRDSACVNSG